jgi:hypothetical protein
LKTDFWGVGDYWLLEAQALKAVGLTNHPKAGELYALAWHYGWQGDIEEVVNVLADLAEMELGNEQV